MALALEFSLSLSKHNFPTPILLWQNPDLEQEVLHYLLPPSSKIKEIQCIKTFDCLISSTHILMSPLMLEEKQTILHPKPRVEPVCLCFCSHHDAMWSLHLNLLAASKLAVPSCQKIMSAGQCYGILDRTSACSTGIPYICQFKSLLIDFQSSSLWMAWAKL